MGFLPPHPVETATVKIASRMRFIFSPAERFG
jgi:hypothetical protein